MPAPKKPTKPAKPRAPRAPSAPKAPARPKPPARPRAPKAPKADASAVYYLRNVTSVPVRIRTSAGDDLNLLARGNRGDMLMCDLALLRDAKVRPNINRIVELLTEDEALAVDASQRTNQQTAGRALHRMIDNPNPDGEDLVVVDHGHIKHIEPTARHPFNPATGEVYRSHQSGVGPRIVTNLPGADAEYAQLMGADDAARNGEDLVEKLREGRR